jgi:hypothetical protein
MPEFIPGKYTSTHESVPEEELTVTFGEYMVTEKYKSRIMDMFEVAIAHWEAEAAEGAESPAQAIAEGVMSTESRSRASALDSWPKLELTTVGNGAQSAQPAAVQKPDSKGRKRGPRPNYETAIKVAEVVRGIAGDGGWPAKLDEICDALDEAKIPRPKTWKKRGHQDWDDALSGERSLVVKAITHHLKLNEVQRKTLG